jgi:uncharacterized protein (TIGR02145 family)
MKYLPNNYLITSVLGVVLISLNAGCNTDDDDMISTAFSCAAGNCESDANGDFATLEACQSACGQGGGSIVSNPGNGVTDASQNSYATVVLGNGQEWMAENLRTASYANGDLVESTTPNIMAGLSTGAWAHYNNDDQFETPHGKLYNWYAANDSRNVCPTGWHVPSLAEFITLVQYLDSETDVRVVNQVTIFSSDVAGGMLKSTGTEHWDAPNTGATNESGLAALPSGYIGVWGSDYLGSYSSWWSSSSHPNSGGNAQALSLYYSDATAESGTPSKYTGRSIRCLKD